VNQTVRGWMNYYRHTNASDAFRRLQRFINTRFRRYLNYRSKGRGFGRGHRFVRYADGTPVQTSN